MDLIDIQEKIYSIRSHKVMLDKDLAVLYGVETKRLKEAVRRNRARFPEDFMFELSMEETAFLRTQFASLEEGRGKHSKYSSFAFTEQGIAMLSSVLNSERAIMMNIAIMSAFIAIRQLKIQYADLVEQFLAVKKTTENHGEQLNLIYDAIENLMDEKVSISTWHKRERIGFKP